MADVYVPKSRRISRFLRALHSWAGARVPGPTSDRSRDRHVDALRDDSFRFEDLQYEAANGCIRVLKDLLTNLIKVVGRSHRSNPMLNHLAQIKVEDRINRELRGIAVPVSRDPRFTRRLLTDRCSASRQELSASRLFLLLANFGCVVTIHTATRIR